ncbi:uncharacterized protein BYT42DRAFT_220646 [Radiomyces spectabilis]|uniref:uncharacterized protein n=1 Tax=Radiomyces spectabilis TaxID=64574 RepID=UPI00221F43BE|nr:uncharacterized protein BYT42DRAFT_220646 [Radiomyces spectabilis]KAI8388068.1 hypothetical protein BYT42DRAFT_220646 [Radiomyces spectabilis]
MKLTALVSLAFACVAVAKPSHDRGYQSPLGVPMEGPPLRVSRRMLDTSRVPFEEHNGNSPWLGQNVDFQYIAPLLKELNSTAESLLSRGEAHITVVTPPEFKTLNTANITIQELNDLAKKHRIQSGRFRAVCLGKEQVEAKGKNYVVYQVIVDAPHLVRLREEIFRLYYEKGGNTALFDPRVRKKLERKKNILIPRANMI